MIEGKRCECDAAYIEQIKLGLRLNRAGILIHVDQGRPEHLGKLVRALLPAYPDLDVFTDVCAVLHMELSRAENMSRDEQTIASV